MKPTRFSDLESVAHFYRHLLISRFLLIDILLLGDANGTTFIGNKPCQMQEKGTYFR
jgi:hypothetical protein